jgi:hypothetical protein
MIAKGRFKAKAVDVGNGVYFILDENENTGNKYVKVKLQLLEGPDEGKQIDWFGTFTEKTVDTTLESLRTLGFKGDDLASKQPLLNEVSIEIQHEADKSGKLRAKVRWINKMGRTESKMDDSTKRMFAASLAAKLKQKPEVGAPVVAPTAAEKPNVEV